MFGSGYPYGAWNTTSIARRPFPFGVWPLYWGDNFMDSNEVGPQLDTIRPGGHISIVPLRTTKENFTVSPDEVYYAVGDSQSLISILISYVTWCHASLSWPTRFDPTSSNTTVKLENVLMYYRASSFALASPAYNNPNSRNASYQPTGEWIPDKIKNSPFWQCLDSTTASALPVLNPPPKEFRDDIIIIVLTSLWMVALAVPALILYVIGWCCFKCRDFIWDELERTAQLSKERVERMENLEYEQYP
ncbi:hypothetical protein PIIN_10948 [Serendipita indica DSM 11827]|uniref:Uncharacterized protein n=1 Tax=Serendipita indica (strain DSM 11827) TaxID=1109443 RepID=G4U072_SERID|nr:hypothetical protein PIIN_10948 [Serendipita indica DSM 11827]